MRGTVMEIKGGRVLVDREDAGWLSQWTWNLHKSTGYVRHCLPDKSTLLMHRLIMGLEAGDPRQVDHKNRNRRDNRRQNLRIVAKGDQASNVSKAKGKASKYRGVTRHKGYWRARVKVDGKLIEGGYFRIEEDADRAARALRRKHLPMSVD